MPGCSEKCPGTESNRRHGDFQSGPTTANEESGPHSSVETRVDPSPELPEAAPIGSPSAPTHANYTSAPATEPAPADTSARPPTTSADMLEHALALAISEAAKAGQWAIVAQLGRELEARRLSGLPNVVTLARSPSRK